MVPCFKKDWIDEKCDGLCCVQGPFRWKGRCIKEKPHRVERLDMAF